MEGVALALLHAAADQAAVGDAGEPEAHALGVRLANIADRSAADDIDEAGAEGRAVELQGIPLRATADVLEPGIPKGQPCQPGWVERENAIALAEVVDVHEQQIGGVTIDTEERALRSPGHHGPDLQPDRRDCADAVAADHHVGLIELEAVGVEFDSGGDHLEHGRIGWEGREGPDFAVAFEQQVVLPDHQGTAGPEGAAGDDHPIARLPGIDRRLNRRGVVGHPVRRAVREILWAPIGH